MRPEGLHRRTQPQGWRVSLATRCPSCGTVFRVVLDQLRISEGWVRCGRCNAVFDAAEVLFDLDQGTAVQLDLSPPMATERLDLPTHTALAPAKPQSNAPATAPAPPDEPVVITDWAGPVSDADATLAAAPIPQAPAAGPGQGQRIEPRFDQPPAGSPTDPLFDAPLLRSPSVGGDDEIRISDAGPVTVPAPQAWATAELPPTAPPPRFLQAADRAAWWRKPAVRTGLAAGVALLAMTAVLQAALLERDTLAAQVPATAPLLQALCRLGGCQVQPPRRIDAITVDSSALGRLDGAGLYRLQLVLRNRADTALLAPALELSLTDSQGKLSVRRVLRLAELGLAQTTLQAGQAVTLQAVLSAGEQRIDGYTVELFYP